jgi:hypothetical protein
MVSAVPKPQRAATSSTEALEEHDQAAGDDERVEPAAHVGQSPVGPQRQTAAGPHDAGQRGHDFDPVLSDAAANTSAGPATSRDCTSGNATITMRRTPPACACRAVGRNDSYPTFSATIPGGLGAG